MSALSVQQIRDYAWMSQASYLDFSSVIAGQESLVDHLQTDTFYSSSQFALAQANAFTDPTTGYGLISQQADTTSGFSATLFAGNAGGYTIAIRGTDPENQFVQDAIIADGLGVVGQGAAKDQLYDAYRYYKQLSSPLGKVSYTQQELLMMARLKLNANDPGVELLAEQLGLELNNDDGLGKIPAGAAVNFTGHSLGGHLAMLLAEMVDHFQGASRIGDIATYNAPGINAIPQEIFNWVGIDTTVQNGAAGSKHLAVVGEGGLNVTAGLGQINGTRRLSFIEDSGLIVGNLLVANHSVVKLSDVYAVKAVFAALDPNIAESLLNGLFKSSSDQFVDSLEKALDCIRRLFGKNDSTVVGDQSSGAARTSLYNNIDDLTKSNEFKALIGKVKISVADTSLATKARTEFSALMALQTLSTMVLSGSNAANQGDLDVELGKVSEALHEAWDADRQLSATDRAAGKANFSDQWLNDRAYFLQTILLMNKQDTLLGGAPNEYQLDLETGQGFMNAPIPDLNLVNQTIFGRSDQADTINGGNGNDHLYGGVGVGSDKLNGGAGDDYLEGNAGDDELESGSGRDTLNGGKGLDSYVVSKGATFTTIRDVDGSGLIIVEHNDGSYSPLGSNIHEIAGSPGSYEDDKDNHYRINGSNLIIQIKDGGQVITIENFASMSGSKLGIDLQAAEAPSAPPPSTLTLTGDYRILDTDASNAGVQPGLDALGNRLTDSTVESIQDDLNGSAGNDTIIGGAGGDILDCKDGNDVLYAEGVVDVAAAIANGSVGSGTPGYLSMSGANNNDLLAGNAGNDTLIGSAGSDVLLGGEGDDLIVGGQGDDFLDGDTQTSMGNSSWTFNWTFAESSLANGTYAYALTDGTLNVNPVSSGNDTLYAGGGDDVVHAGFGNDLVFGEDGNDKIFGDRGSDTLLGGDGNDTLYGDTGWITTNDPAYDAADFLDGGAGDDTLNAGGGSDVVFGGTDNDTLVGDRDNQYAGDVYLNGEDGNDELFLLAA